MECLRDVEKCCGTVLLVFKSFIYPLYDTASLFYCGVPLPEVELMIGDKLLVSTSGRSLFKGIFSKTLDAVGRKLIGR
jgi:hypothetical protein